MPGRIQTILAVSALTGAVFGSTAVPASAQSTGISCSDLPVAAAFVGKLQPGPNTNAAEKHLEAAKRASSDKQCVAELRQVDYYARRSVAADQRHAEEVRQLPPGEQASSVHKVSRVPHVPCADFLHRDRPGGSDYHGPPVPGCP